MRPPAEESVILMAEIGSTAHGIIHSTNDIDEIAIFVPRPMESRIGFEADETYVYRPGRAPHEPSGPGDLDRTYHSLHKFVKLLVAGNPSILFTLFAPQRRRSWLGNELIERRDELRHSKTRDRYLGYMQGQRERIQGTRGSAGRIRRSPEGGGAIDWKYAMHMLRLGYQAYEYLDSGRITCPVPEPARSQLIAVRAGEVPLPEVLMQAEVLEQMVKDIPVEEPDDKFYTFWADWLAGAHIRWWRGGLW